MSNNPCGFKCDQCNLNFVNKKVLQKHKNEKHAQNAIKCLKCDLRFSNTEFFRIHWNKKHVSASKTHIDPASSASNLTVSEGDEDEDSDSDSDSSVALPKTKTAFPKSNRCNVCYKTFASHSFAMLHFRRVHMDWSVSCTVCDKRMKKNLYRPHLLQHKNNGQITDEEMQIELKVEKKVKEVKFAAKKDADGPSKCPCCGKIFNLSRSMRIHHFYCKKPKQATNIDDGKIQLKPKFPCLKCGAIFDKSITLKIHSIRAHKTTEKKTGASGILGKPNFKSVLDLRPEVPDMVIETNVCPICKKTFSSLCHAQRHFETVHCKKHVASCPYTQCLARCSNTYNLRYHFLSAHPKARLPKSLETTRPIKKRNRRVNPDILSKQSETNHQQEPANSKVESMEIMIKEVPKVDTAKDNPLMRMFKKMQEKNAAAPPKSVNISNDVIEIVDDNKNVENSMLTLNFEQCTECDHKFDNRNSAQMHYHLTHPNEMQLCPECDMLIINSRSMLYHWKIKHAFLSKPLYLGQTSSIGLSKQLFTNFKQKTCGVCDKVFSTAVESRKHFIDEHEIAFEICSLCLKGFHNERLLLSHWRKRHYDMPFKRYANDKRKNCKEPYKPRTIYPFIKGDTCPICDRKYAKREYCITHYKTAHLKTKVICEVCKYEFATVEHLMEHWSVMHKNIPWKQDMENERKENSKNELSCAVFDEDKIVGIAAEDMIQGSVEQSVKTSNIKLVVSLVDLKDDIKALAPNVREQLVEISREIVNAVAEPVPENKEEKIFILLSSDESSHSQEEPLDLSIGHKDKPFSDDELLVESKVHIKLESASETITSQNESEVLMNRENHSNIFNEDQNVMVVVENIDIKEELILE